MKRKSIHAHMKTATGLSYSHYCRLKIGKSLLLKIKLIKNGGKKRIKTLKFYFGHFC